MLTREEILALPTGRELDVLVAQQIMNLELEEGRGHFGKVGPSWAKLMGIPDEIYNKPNLVIKDVSTTTKQREVPKYSTEISAAWEVVEKMDGWDFTIVKAGKYCEVSIGSRQAIIRESVQESICKAALLAVIDT